MTKKPTFARHAQLPAALALLALTVVLMPTPWARAHVRITTDVTWTNNVRQIVRDRCMSCHSARGIAPDYADFTVYGSPGKPGAYDWKTAMEEEILTHKMPPWDADPRYGRFSNSRALSKREIDLFIAWSQGGGPQGLQRDQPVPPEMAPDAWYLGDPDIVLQAPEAFVLKADQDSATAHFEIPIEVDEAKWITAYEFRPQHPQATYRMAAWIVDAPDAEPEQLKVEVQVPYDPFAPTDTKPPTRMREMPEGRRFLGQWLRGDVPVLLPNSAGKRLRPGSKLELEVEYGRYDQGLRGKEITDQSSVGLFVSQNVQEVDKIAESVALAASDPPIKKGSDKPVTADVTLEHDVELIALAPDLGDLLHQLELVAHYPDGRDVTLLYIPEYHAEYPSSYLFEEPVKTPEGTRLELRGWFDAPGEADAAEQKLAMVVDYTLEDHLVLPEVIPPPKPDSGPQTGMFALFGDSQPDDAAMVGGEAVRSGGMPPATSPSPAPADQAPKPAGAHMNHTPLHGGQFFMAQNQYHHLEGTLSDPGKFRLYVYDDFKKPIDPRNFGGKVVFEHYNKKTREFTEESYPLDPVAGTEYLMSEIPEALPAEFYASVWLGGKQNRYDFYFDKLTTEPAAPPKPVATTSAAGAAGGHTHVRPPLTIPDDPKDIAREIVVRLQGVEDVFASRDFRKLYVPAFDARDLAEAILAKLDGLRPRDVGRARIAVGRIRRTAEDLDRAGDLTEEARTREALQTFRENVNELASIFKVK